LASNPLRTRWGSTNTVPEFSKWNPIRFAAVPTVEFGGIAAQPSRMSLPVAGVAPNWLQLQVNPNIDGHDGARAFMLATDLRLQPLGERASLL
jgi:hypothetical protein